MLPASSITLTDQLKERTDLFKSLKKNSAQTAASGDFIKEDAITDEHWTFSKEALSGETQFRRMTLLYIYGILHSPD